MEYQMTIASPVVCEGIGLHSGKPVHMRFLPAPEDTGIVFVRTDLDDLQIEAVAENVTTTIRATAIGMGKGQIFTIEHLMSALHALQIDNCYIELNAEEPPVSGGSAAEFLHILQKAGTQQQHKARHTIDIDRIYRVEEAEKFVVALPYDGLRISFTSLNEHPFIGTQYCDFTVNEATYGKEIAPARTIAYEKEIAALQKMGLGLGGSLDSVIIYNDDGWINELRYPDELVRHKVLDIIGDLRLAGGTVRGHFIAVKSGHKLNTQLAKLIRQAELDKQRGQE